MLWCVEVNEIHGNMGIGLWPYAWMGCKDNDLIVLFSVLIVVDVMDELYIL